MNARNSSESITQTLQDTAYQAVMHGARPARNYAKQLRISIGLLLLALSASVFAQTRFCVGGDLDHMSATAIAGCQAKMAGVREAARLRGVPADWHFVVVCDEVGWKDYTSFSQSETGMLTGANYSTDPRLRWTFLRGTELNAEQPETTATVIAAALESVPSDGNSPRLSPSAKPHQYSIAMAHRRGTKTMQQ